MQPAGNFSQKRAKKFKIKLKVILRLFYPVLEANMGCAKLSLFTISKILFELIMLNLKIVAFIFLAIIIYNCLNRIFVDLSFSTGSTQFKKNIIFQGYLKKELSK
jgi:hypothetical protein